MLQQNTRAFPSSPSSTSSAGSSPVEGSLRSERRCAGWTSGTEARKRSKTLRRTEPTAGTRPTDEGDVERSGRSCRVCQQVTRTNALHRLTVVARRTSSSPSRSRRRGTAAELLGGVTRHAEGCLYWFRASL